MNKTMQMYKELTDAYGVPGYEADIRAVVKQYVSKTADDVSSDNLGSVIAKREGKDQSVSILFLAHMDECGFMVKSVDDKGFARILPLGGWNPPVALGQRVTIQTKNGPVVGIIGAKPPHGMSEDERKKPIQLDDLWIDAGVASDFNPGEKVPIRPGDPVIPFGGFEPTPNPKIHIARNWDNRVGCAVLLHIFEALKKKTPPCNVYGAFAVQEEVGLRGAATSGWKADPDLAVALDVSQGYDTPGESVDACAKLGGGASILVYDRSMIPHLGLRDAIADIAKAKKIPHHFTTVQGGYDTGRVHLQRDGVPSCVIGIPSRYIHGFASMVHADDIKSAAKLSVALIEKTDKALVKKLKRF